MDFKEFVSWLTQELGRNIFVDYSSYKMIAQNPTTQEWSKLVKRLDQSPNREPFVKVRRGHKQQIAFSNMEKIENLKLMQNKGFLTIEWAGNERVSQELGARRPNRRDVLSNTIDEIRAQLAQFASLDLASRVARLEKSVLGEAVTEEESRGRIYEIVSLLLPYLVGEGEDISISSIVDRIGILKNFRTPEGRCTLDRLTLMKTVLELVRDRPEVFSVRDAENRDIGASHVYVHSGDNLIMLRLYPRQGLYYNLHHLGQGRSPLTNSLVKTMRGEFTEISRLLRSLRLRTDVTAQMVFTIACGVADPKWYFADETNEILADINKQLTTQGCQLVQSNGLWFISKVARRSDRY